MTDGRRQELMAQAARILPQDALERHSDILNRIDAISAQNDARIMEKYKI